MVSTLLTIFNLFLLEVMLSIDNAAVLAIMVRDLPVKDRPHALRYGIMGAFILRGASLFFISLLIRLVYLKVVGGLYLLYLVYGHFFRGGEEAGEIPGAGDRRIYRFFNRRLGISRLWATIILVEIMDMSFSVDNIFASVAMTQDIVLILIGVFIGIIAMRFVAQIFSWLMVRFPSLETSAFVVIGLLGVKLIGQPFLPGIDTQGFDLLFSALMLLVFIFPILKPGSWQSQTKRTV